MLRHNNIYIYIYVIFIRNHYKGIVDNNVYLDIIIYMI